MAYAFNDDKSKVEVYSKDEAYNKNEVYSKDEIANLIKTKSIQVTVNGTVAVNSYASGFISHGGVKVIGILDVYAYGTGTNISNYFMPIGRIKTNTNNIEVTAFNINEYNRPYSTVTFYVKVAYLDV